MAATALDHLSLGGRIDWLAQLDTAFQPAKNYRRTSIVRTALAFAPLGKNSTPRTWRLISSCVQTDLHDWPKDQLCRGLEQAPHCGSQRCPNVSNPRPPSSFGIRILKADLRLPGTSPTYVPKSIRDTGFPPTNSDIQGEYSYHQSVIDNARAAEKAQPGRQLAIALDTKGPVCEYLCRKQNKRNKTEQLLRKSGPETLPVMLICPSRLAPS